MEEKMVFREEKDKREASFLMLYKNVFPSFARYVSKSGGALEEARDIFQDALVIWFEKSSSLKIQPDRSDSAYVFGTARHLWIKRYRSASLEMPLDESVILSEAEGSEPYFASDKLLDFLEAAGQRCMELLKAFYYDKLSPAKLAALFGFSGERSATVQKYKCLEKVRNEVKQRSLSYEDFTS